MLTCRRAVPSLLLVEVQETRWRYLHNILRVAIILNPTLVNSIEHFPAAARDSFQNKVNILQAVSESHFNRPREACPISKTPFVFVLLLRKEGPDSRSCPAEDGNYEGNLDLVAWMDELGVINSPERPGELNELLFTK